MPTIDVTKVNLKPKSVMYLAVAFIALFLALDVGKWGANKVKTMIAGATASAASAAEEF